MTDNNNLIVYCEFEHGKVADVSLELLTKGRVLADCLGVKLEALVIGDKLDGIENTHMGQMLFTRLRTNAFTHIHQIPIRQY